MLIRHTAVVLLTLGLITAPVAVAAQGPSRVPRIGVIGERSPGDSFLRAFQLGLRELGYTEGQSIVVEYRYAHGALDRVPELAAALVRSGVDVLVVGGVVHTVSGLSGSGVEPGREPPGESSSELDLPLVAAAPVDVRLTVESEGRGARLKVRLVDASGTRAPVGVGMMISRRADGSSR